MFKTLLMVVVLLATPFGQTMTPQKIMAGGYLKTGEFLDLNDAQREAFAAGFLDGIFIAPLLDAPNRGKLYEAIRTCTAEMPANQVAAIIEKFVRDNPEDWHKPLNVVAFNAILKACHATP